MRTATVLTQPEASIGGIAKARSCRVRRGSKLWHDWTEAGENGFACRRKLLGSMPEAHVSRYLLKDVAARPSRGALYGCRAEATTHQTARRDWTLRSDVSSLPLRR